MNIVIIEDERIKRITMSEALRKVGYNVNDFSNPILALNYFEKNGADLVISDIRMEDIDGFEVLERVKKNNPAAEVILITAYGTIDSAVDAMKKGAFDYITKPFSSENLIVLVKKLEKIIQLEEENKSLKKIVGERYSFHKIIGKSELMQKMFDQIETVADNDMSVLIEGESGTGKELVANAIHYNSGRKNSPLIKLSCAILNESILESELFGHERGSFTGAIKSKVGKFQLANNGTLFLDDIDDIPLASQVKLLRVLQEKEFEKVGGNETIKVNVRVICATKIDLWQKVQNKEFREDLYYRLNVIPIRLPKLFERKEDIPLLIEHFCDKINKPNLKFHPEALKAMAAYSWPGNIRQLENTISRIAAFAESDLVKKEDIPHEIICGETFDQCINLNDRNQINLEKLTNEVELSAINWALNKTKFNQSQAAKLLNLKRTTLRDKMIKYNILTNN